MKEMVDKLVSIERQISTEKGGFSLFGLFLREDAPNVWDVVAAAPWFTAHDGVALHYIAKILQSRLARQELVSLAGIFLVNNDDPRLEDIHELLNMEHGTAVLKNEIFFDMEIKRAYIITSKRENAQPPVGAS